MSVSMNELALAREVVGGVLEELSLDAYMFEVEPRDDQWEIRVECAVEDGWTSCRVTAAKESLLHRGDNAAARQVLIEALREAVSACLRRS